MATVEIAPLMLTTPERIGLGQIAAKVEVPQIALLSLYRFGLAEQTPWGEQAPGEKTWAPRLTEKGTEALEALRGPYWGPRLCCEHAVLLDCVCRYASACPVGHAGNGCHGTHD